ncbi:SDR family NAD(P)-dependent oxidoreductase [Gracilinema caldarium]|uniref:Sorbitol-6-phosphate 2-dehydrogenase n=1 Tax=Gracilinema caldarium (strain ATCC 51460 / DSM 7334 / H1) TaxID=744872 RepID=F8EXV0_GRAC1|nr:SDR family NAD(P)-dependent oxidoreductase [Gracilinema caldarium]AEJ20114.1 Sorbitol-6-phosphate 2-dehydrogenase [Gracilinema caldarium DSM 7334]
MNRLMQIIAPILRGLYLHATGQSVVVLPGNTLVETECHIDVRPAMQGEDIHEEMAAKIASETCKSWIFEHSPSGVDALQTHGISQQLPSCIQVQTTSNIYTFWVDWDLDRCRDRIQRLDTQPLEISSQTKSMSSYEQLFQSRIRIAERKVALITGGAQGFGEELVQGLVGAGALVFIADLNYNGAQTLANRLNTHYGRTVALPVACNVAEETSVQEMVAHIVEQAGGLDICVSNAGILKAGSVLDQELAAFKLVTDVNYTAFFLVTKYVAQVMRCQALTAPEWYTDIIQINSKSGLEGSNKNGAYAGSKFGGIGLVQSFAMELVEYNIKVNAICPGNFFDGPLWSDPQKGLFVQYLQTGKVLGAKTVTDVRAFYEAKIPMKRGCTGPDVLRALFYIIEQVYETGQAVPVTGGQVMLH